MTDDLDALRCFRDEVDNPSGTSWAVARAALTVAMHPEHIRRPGKTRRPRARRWRPLALLAVLVLGGTTGALAATGAIDFGGPPPVPSRGGALIACPNPTGLEPFNSATRERAVQLARTYGRVSLTVDLKHSDRAWWPKVRHMWRTAEAGQGMFETVRELQSGPRMFQAIVARRSCGSKLVTDSLDVVLGPRSPDHSADVTINIVFLDRRGTPLIYWIH